MGKNVIVSEETLRDLLEAHASLSAWYYELWSALRRAGTSANAPDDAARAAFVERIAADFPEVASVARSIQVPRMFVPPPPSVATAKGLAGDAADATTAIEPATARAREGQGAAEAAEPADPAIAPPPLVVPSQVKYEP